MKKRLMFLLLLLGMFAISACGQIIPTNSTEQIANQNKPEEVNEELELVNKSKKQSDYYVSPNGVAPSSNSEPICTLDDPCSLEKALSKVKAGNTIFMLEGRYYPEKIINIPTSGSKRGYLTIRNYRKDKVTLDGKNILGDSGGVINVKDKSYIKIKGLEITNYKSTNGVIMGIYVSGTASHIQLINNYIHDIESPNALGIAIYGTNAQNPIHDLLVQDNLLKELVLGFSEVLTVAGNVTDFTIRRNIIHDANNIGIDVAGSYGHACWDDNNLGNDGPNCNALLDYARNGKVLDNTIYNIDTRNNPAYPDPTINAAAGIYVDGARNIVVERNKVHNAGVGISVSSENSGGVASNTIVRNNFIYNNWRTGINLGPVGVDLGSVNNCKIINNTLFNNDRSAGWGGELYLEYNVIA